MFHTSPRLTVCVFSFKFFKWDCGVDHGLDGGEIAACLRPKGRTLSCTLGGWRRVEISLKDTGAVCVCSCLSASDIGGCPVCVPTICSGKPSVFRARVLKQPSYPPAIYTPPICWQFKLCHFIICKYQIFCSPSHIKNDNKKFKLNSIQIL